MVVLGIILIIAGLVIPSLHILFTIGVILVIIGAVLWVLGSTGRAIGGRKHYY
jgi:hypothetical protein